MTWHPGTPEEYKNQIVTGDARELAKRIPDESVDLILCDPIYWNIEDYTFVASEAVRILRQGGNLIMETCSEYRFAIEQTIAEIHLQPNPLLCEAMVLGQSMWKYKVRNFWRPHLWYSKGKRIGGWTDNFFSKGLGNKRWHKWGGENPAFYFEIISKLVSRGGMIIDPYTGSGTVPAVCKMLGRNYIAFEIDPETAELARERVRNTQPPLFVMEPEQLELPK